MNLQPVLISGGSYKGDIPERKESNLANPPLANRVNATSQTPMKELAETQAISQKPLQVERPAFAETCFQSLKDFTNFTKEIENIIAFLAPQKMSGKVSEAILAFEALKNTLMQASSQSTSGVLLDSVKQELAKIGLAAQETLQISYLVEGDWDKFSSTAVGKVNDLSSAMLLRYQLLDGLRVRLSPPVETLARRAAKTDLAAETKFYSLKSYANFTKSISSIIDLLKEARDSIKISEAILAFETIKKTLANASLQQVSGELLDSVQQELAMLDHVMVETNQTSNLVGDKEDDWDRLTSSIVGKIEDLSSEMLSRYQLLDGLRARLSTQVETPVRRAMPAPIEKVDPPQPTPLIIEAKKVKPKKDYFPDDVDLAEVYMDFKPIYPDFRNFQRP